MRSRVTARRVVDIGNAIDYTHDRSVLHRVIKLGNIIVGKQSVTLLVDWGLARATSKAMLIAEKRTLIPSSASGGTETLLGSALGMPAFMSPEQTCGDLDRLRPRSTSTRSATPSTAC